MRIISATSTKPDTNNTHRRAKYVARQPKIAKDQRMDNAVSAQKIQIQQQAEERRRLRDGLEREKIIWKRQKDVAKAIGWIIERIGEEE